MAATAQHHPCQTRGVYLISHQMRSSLGSLLTRGRSPHGGPLWDVVPQHHCLFTVEKHTGGKSIAGSCSSGKLTSHVTCTRADQVVRRHEPFLKTCGTVFPARLIFIDIMHKFFVCDLTSGLYYDKLFLVTVVQSQISLLLITERSPSLERHHVGSSGVNANE